MPRNTKRVAALLPFLLLVVTGCTAGPSDRPAVAYHDDESAAQAPQPPEPAPVPGLGGPAADTLHWQDCTPQTTAELGSAPPGMVFSCAQMLSILDAPEAPERGTQRNALIRIGDGTHVPLVVVGDINGEPGTTFAARLAAQLPPEVHNTFDIIGVDRRGTGESDPADCMQPAERESIVGFDPRATERPQLDRLLDSVVSASQECLLTLDERLQAYDSWRTASDLEELRLELGVPKLHLLGRGEASRLLTTYAERYPQSVGRMVLDGAPDPTRDAIGRAESQARAAENAFDEFAERCVARGCPLGEDPRRAVGDLVERARSTPLPANGSVVPAGRVVRALQLGLRDQSSWPALADALAAGVRGDGTQLAEISAPLLQPQGTAPPWLDGHLITKCNDTTLRVPPQRSSQLAADWVNRFPLFGGLAAQRIVWCGSWPVPQRPLPTPRRGDLPPIPVITTEHDPQTLALGTDHMAQQLPTGVQLRWQGAGHGALGRSGCITDAVARYLVRGAVPTEGMVCPA